MSVAQPRGLWLGVNGSLLVCSKPPSAVAPHRYIHRDLRERRRAVDRNLFAIGVQRDPSHMGDRHSRRRHPVLGRGGREHRGLDRRRRRLGWHQPFAASEPIRVGPHHMGGQPPPVLRMRPQVDVDAGVHQRAGRQPSQRNRARAPGEGVAFARRRRFAVARVPHRDTGLHRAVEHPVQRDIRQRPARPWPARDVAMRPAEPDFVDAFRRRRQGDCGPWRPSTATACLPATTLVSGSRVPCRPGTFTMSQSPKNCTGTPISRCPASRAASRVRRRQSCGLRRVRGTAYAAST